MYEIEKGVPLVPHGESNKGPKDKKKYPFRDLEVGDSFLIPLTGNETPHEVLKTRRHAISAFHGAKSNGKIPKTSRIVTRLVDQGLRVWRIA